MRKGHKLGEVEVHRGHKLGVVEFHRGHKLVVRKKGVLEDHESKGKEDHRMGDVVHKGSSTGSQS